MVAGYRARATDRPDPVCSDPWAGWLAGDEGVAFCEAFDQVQPAMELWIAVRTAAIDARVRALTRAEATARQVVLLGAGLDTRAARLATPGVRYFEVDQPASQADRRARLAAVPTYPQDVAVEVACDFEREDFLERLVAAGFDPAAPAVIVWEGVSCYLHDATVRATLGRIASACNPETTVLFDYVGKALAAGDARDAGDRDTIGAVAGHGEPIRWGTHDVLPLLYAAGFRRVRARTFDELALEYTGTYDRARRWRFQSIAEASVSGRPS